MDSGTPSSSAPTAMASPLPFCFASVGCWTHPPQRLRCWAPRLASRQLHTQKTSAPRRKPPTVGPAPPSLKARSISSTESTAISTPPPKPITAAMSRCGSSTKKAISAPSTRPVPARNPQHPAWTDNGIINAQPVVAWRSPPRESPPCRMRGVRGFILNLGKGSPRNTRKDTKKRGSDFLAAHPRANSLLSAAPSPFVLFVSFAEFNPGFSFMAFRYRGCGESR